MKHVSQSQQLKIAYAMHLACVEIWLARLFASASKAFSMMKKMEIVSVGK
jgi:hypothetical protein